MPLPVFSKLYGATGNNKKTHTSCSSLKIRPHLVYCTQTKWQYSNLAHTQGDREKNRICNMLLEECYLWSFIADTIISM